MKKELSNCLATITKNTRFVNHKEYTKLVNSGAFRETSVPTELQSVDASYVEVNAIDEGDYFTVEMNVHTFDAGLRLHFTQFFNTVVFKNSVAGLECSDINEFVMKAFEVSYFDFAGVKTNQKIYNCLTDAIAGKKNTL